MTQPGVQSAWIVLPCMLISLLLTRLLTTLFTSHNERGLSIVAKAALIFTTTLVLTIAAANSLFQSSSPENTPPANPHPRNILHKKRNISPVNEDKVHNWREDTAPTLRWSSSSSDEAKQVKPANTKKLSKETSERLDEKSLRKRLARKFKPKRNEMLGVRKETVEEVVREDPLV